MPEVDSQVNLGFKMAGGLGPDNPMLRGVVGLRRRCDADAGVAPGPGFAKEADHLSGLMYHSVLMTAVDLDSASQTPIASVRRTLEVRDKVELSDILVDPDYAERDVLASVMIALNCHGRDRLRPVAANVNPAHKNTVGLLDKLGFSKDEEWSGIEIYSGVPAEDYYTLSSGQLAIRRNNRLPGGRALLKQARRSLHWV
ncbi:MAG TPA: hypothetical protein VFK11_01035 [Candidatus Saccharimonadales bacterium]|nr:hypothetical protein [Candidatus Saccharimonadales bacterium]